MKYWGFGTSDSTIVPFWNVRCSDDTREIIQRQINKENNLKRKKRGNIILNLERSRTRDHREINPATNILKMHSSEMKKKQVFNS